MKRRHPERVPEYLQHIVAAIDRALSYTSTMDFATFEGDTRTQDAVIRSIEIVGEAANKVRTADPDFAAQRSEIPWDLMYGMRNRIVHDYFEVDIEVVWQTVKKDLPVLRQQIEPLLRAPQ
jgi:uncharacterized protein with HEPN domain